MARILFANGKNDQNSISYQKLCENNGMNRYVVTTVNYVVAASISLIIALGIDVKVKLYNIND